MVRNLLEHDKEFVFDDSTEGYTLTVNEPKLVKLQLVSCVLSSVPRLITSFRQEHFNLAP